MAAKEGSGLSPSGLLFADFTGHAIFRRFERADRRTEAGVSTPAQSRQNYRGL